MCSMTFEMPETIDHGGGGNYLREKGKFLLQVLNAEKDPVSKGGTLMNGFKYELAVVNEGEQKGQTIDLMFWDPKLTDSEENQLKDRMKQAAALIAVGLVSMKD